MDTELLILISIIGIWAFVRVLVSILRLRKARVEQKRFKELEEQIARIEQRLDVLGTPGAVKKKD